MFFVDSRIPGWKTFGDRAYVEHLVQWQEKETGRSYELNNFTMWKHNHFFETPESSKLGGTQVAHTTTPKVVHFDIHPPKRHTSSKSQATPLYVYALVVAA